MLIIFFSDNMFAVAFIKYDTAAIYIIIIKSAALYVNEASRGSYIYLITGLW